MFIIMNNGNTSMKQRTTVAKRRDDSRKKKQSRAGFFFSRRMNLLSFNHRKHNDGRHTNAIMLRWLRACTRNDCSQIDQKLLSKTTWHSWLLCRFFFLFVGMKRKQVRLPVTGDTVTVNENIIFTVTTTTCCVHNDTYSSVFFRWKFPREMTPK